MEVGVDLAVNDLANNITISPNPANEFIQVAFTTPLSGNVVIQVKNIVGEVVNTTTGNASNTTINISNLAAGIYFVEINNDGTIVSQKIEKL